jgi:hypothetical protein
VPNTKVVANIQIFFHANFSHFPKVPNYFFIFYSLLLIYSIGKIVVDRFLRGRPSSAPIPAHLHARAGLLAHYRVTVADRWTLVRPSSPKSLLPCSAPACPHRPISHQRASHPSPPRATRMAAWSPATLSYRISCGAPWCPITATRCSAASHRCSSWDARARSSIMKPHAAHPAGRADAAESGPSRSRRSPTSTHA